MTVKLVIGMVGLCRSVLVQSCDMLCSEYRNVPQNKLPTNIPPTRFPVVPFPMINCVSKEVYHEDNDLG